MGGFVMLYLCASNPPNQKLEQKVGALNEILLKVALKESAYKPFPRSYRILQEMFLI